METIRIMKPFLIPLQFLPFPKSALKMHFRLKMRNFEQTNNFVNLFKMKNPKWRRFQTGNILLHFPKMVAYLNQFIITKFMIVLVLWDFILVLPLF
jgi:hypothetical protein